MNKLNVFFIFLIFSGFGLFSFIPSFLPIPSGIATGLFRFIILFFCFGVIFIQIYNNKVTIKSKVVPIIIVLSLYIYQLYFDLIYTDLPFGRTNSEVFILSLIFLVIPFISIIFIRLNDKEIVKISYLIFIVATIVSLLALIFGFINGYQYRLSGNDILNPISLGHIATTGLILNIYFFKFVSKASRPTKIFSLLSLIICFITLILSASRGPLLSLIFVVLTLFILNSKNRAQSFFILFIFAFIGVSGVLIMEDYLGSLTARFSIDLGDGTGKGDGEARVFLWTYAVMLFIENPILGVSTTTEFGYVHNMFLEILMSTGLVGGVFLVSILISCFLKIRLSVKNKDLSVIFGLLFIQYSTSSLFSGTVYTNELMWISAALIFSSEKISTYRTGKKNDF